MNASVLYQTTPATAPQADPWTEIHELLRPKEDPASNGLLPLYVGKTAADLAARIGKHLMLKTQRTVRREHTQAFSKRLNTSCQVRDRLDRLFPNVADTRELVLWNG